jgi:hypothetical protein
VPGNDSLFDSKMAGRRQLASAPVAETAACPPEVLERFLPASQSLSRLPLSEFFAEGLYVRVWSRVLGEWIVFAADDAVLPDPGPLVVYREAEWPALRRLKEQPEVLKTVHVAKRVLQARLLPD